MSAPLHGDRLRPPWRECASCHALHAASVCHVCKTPVADVPLDDTESSSVDQTDSSPWGGSDSTQVRRAA